MVSCSSDNTSSEGTLRIKAKATYTNAGNKNTSDIVITSFKVNISEIGFEVAEGMNSGDDDNSNGDSDGDNNDGLYNDDDETELTISEMIKLDIKVGDTIMGGKFKNKKVVVKTIDKNEKGDVLINGKPLLRFRIIKE
jgi:hypothetical protein